jgi:hypothetical protein
VRLNEDVTCFGVIALEIKQAAALNKLNEVKTWMYR